MKGKIVGAVISLSLLTGLAAAAPPSINNLDYSPKPITVSDALTIEAEVTDDGEVDEVNVEIFENGSSVAQQNMVFLGGDFYTSGNILNVNYANYTAEVTATDNTSETASEKIIVGFPNREPNIDNVILEPSPPEGGETLTLRANASDPDTQVDSVDYELINLDEPSIVDVGAMNFNGVEWRAEDVGTLQTGVQYEFSVTAFDAEGEESTLINQFVARSSPELRSLNLSKNKSGLVFGENVSLIADVFDSGVSVSEVKFSGTEGSTTIFSNANGSVNQDGFWESGKITLDEVDKEYTLTLESATSDLSEDFSESVSFKIRSPNLSIKPATSVEFTSANLNGDVPFYGDIKDGDASYFYEYRKKNSSSWKQTQPVNFNSDTEEFSTEISGLSEERQVYEYRMVVSWNPEKKSSIQTFTSKELSISNSPTAFFFGDIGQAILFVTGLIIAAVGYTLYSSVTGNRLSVGRS